MPEPEDLIHDSILDVLITPVSDLDLKPSEPTIDEITVPINESELEQFVTIRQADENMKLDVRAFRELILSEFPIDDLFAQLNVDGEITPEDLAESIFLIQDWFMGDSVLDPDNFVIDPNSLAAIFIDRAGNGFDYGGAVGKATLEVG